MTSPDLLAEKSFFRRGLAAFGVNIISAGLMFGLHVLLARLMGDGFYGVYIYALTWVLILTLVAKLGFDTALVRLIPKYKVADEWGRLRGVLNRSLLLCFGVGVLLGALIFAVTLALRDRISPELESAFLIGAFLVPALGVMHLLQAALRGLKLVPKNELPDRVIRPLLMMGAVAYLALQQNVTPRADLVMGVHLGAVFISGLFAVVWLRNAFPPQCKVTSSIYETRQWLAVALPLAAFSGVHMLLANVDILMVGSLAGTQQAGIYAVAARIAVFTIFALTAVNAIAAPVITELYETGNHQGLQRMLTKYARINMAFAMIATAAFYGVGEFALQWFGSAFSIAFPALIILCAGHIVNAAAGSVGFLLIMTGHEKQALFILVFTVIVNVVLNALMIPAWGITGAAIATALSTVLWNGAMWVYARQKLGFNTAAISASL